jgi:hypothetical protein
MAGWQWSGLLHMEKPIDRCQPSDRITTTAIGAPTTQALATIEKEMP